MSEISTLRNSQFQTTSRRTLLIRAVRLAGGAALVGGSSIQVPQRVAAQPRTLTLRGSAGSLTVGPGAAVAQGAVAGAAAEDGMARVQAAASLSAAASDGETVAAGTVALAAADPNQGAVAQGALATANAITEPSPAEESIAPVATGGSGRGRRVRKARAGRRPRGRDRVKALPATGSGGGAQPVAPLFGLASVVTALGAFLLRHRADDGMRSTS
jgi:hypothetical protein